MAFQTHQFPYGDDNYGLLLHCTESNFTACVDAGDAAADARQEQQSRAGCAAKEAPRGRARTSEHSEHLTLVP